MVAGVAAWQPGSERISDHLGVGEGQMYSRSGVMPVEGRTLASGNVCERGKER